MSKTDPEHYRHGRIEPMDVAEDWDLDRYLHNVVKYIGRHEHKGDPLGDLQKAKWYLDRKLLRMNAALHVEAAHRGAEQAAEVLRTGRDYLNHAWLTGADQLPETD